MNEKVISLAHMRPHPYRSAMPLGHALRRRMHHFVVHFVAPISRHPAMTLITGLGLFISGVFELLEQIFTDFESVVGVHQGVILLGIVTFLRGLADMVEASEWLSKGAEQEESTTRNAL